MSRRRYLSSDAGRDKGLRDVARASLFAHSLYLLAIPCAADDCSLPTNDPDELLWEIWPAMARDYGAEDVQAAIDLLIAHHLWEYGPTGRLRYPPRSFYRHQTYIRDDRRACAPDAEQHSAPVRTGAQPTINGETRAQNAEEQRTSAQNGAEHRFVKDSLSSSSSFSLSSSPATPSASLGLAPDADAPDASRPTKPAASLALLVPNALVLGEQSEEPPARATGTEPDEEPPLVTALRPGPSDAPEAMTRPGPLHAPIEVPKPKGHPFGELWDAFDAVFGEARTHTEQSRRGRACKEARESHVSGEELLLAAQHWPNVMGDATMTELGIMANLGKLLHGPQVNGRSNGTVTAHTQRLTETALLPHQATVTDIRRRRKANDEPGR
jgi:hypothetical protein